VLAAPLTLQPLLQFCNLVSGPATLHRSGAFHCCYRQLSVSSGCRSALASETASIAPAAFFASADLAWPPTQGML